MNRIDSIKRQRGATFLGVLTIVAILGFAVYAGMRLVPKFIDNYSVVAIMKKVAVDLKDSSPTPAEVRRALENKWITDYVYDVQAKDIKITKVPTGIEMRAEYEAIAPFVSNVSFVVTFNEAVVIAGGRDR